MSSQARDRSVGRGDATPIAGGSVDISRFLVDRPAFEAEPDDDLGREIATLAALHPNLVKFRAADLAQMDDATKRILLEDIRGRLRIRPFLKQEL